MLPILYRDARLVACAKPAGLLVHRTALDRHACDFAVQRLRRQLGRPVYPCHRLDRGTSGVLLFALDLDALRRLGEAFESRRVDKRYVAVVRGWPADAGVVDHPLSRLEEAAERADARSALTRFRTLARVELPVRADRYPTARYALVELEPLTGRRHQLRRHLKHLGHPIVGDTTYGKGAHNRLFRERYGCERLLLAAVSLGFDHPDGDARTTVVAPLAADFAAVVDALGWGDALPAAWRAPLPGAPPAAPPTAEPARSPGHPR